MLRTVDSNQSLPELEREVLQRWRGRDIFKESIRRREREGAEPWVFWEGPPTANGRPGVHHVLSRAFKDVYPRFHTMRGRLVRRKGGWDCHGLPVEIAVEKQLGLASKTEIEQYGIAKFNAACRESVFSFLEDWDLLTERIGFWVDLEQAYRTLDNGYVESVWWALKQIADKGLLYEGHRVVPYCPRCGTALSSHELALGYADVVDDSAYVRLAVTEPSGPLSSGDELLVWTTTPWTLIANAAAAVAADVTYVRARPTGGDATFVLAEQLVEPVLGTAVEILARFAGSAIAGTRYRPPFDYIATSEYGDNGHRVLVGDFVTADDGTGIVHTAVVFGEDDYRFGLEHGLAVINPVGPDGSYDERIGAYAGRFVKDCDQDLIAELKATGRLLRSESYEHSYPHCWRCSTPLIYYAKPSWYIATSGLRERLLAANQSVGWQPPHIKDGRMGSWLEGNVDWALSRERYWGTPLPVWRSDDHQVTRVIGSFAELEALSGRTIDDPHRPYVDEITFTDPASGKLLRRVPEVIDVWFDSGAMPFAQWHAPFENEQLAADSWPADFICEAQDQTRGWFYSLLAISVLLEDRAPYKNVVCLGLINDEHGQKMSKSKGNVVEPMTVIDRFGADALRWYFFSSKQPWDGYRFSEEQVAEGVRLFLRTLWNTYGFYVLYAQAASIDGQATDRQNGERPLLDRWLDSRLAATVATVTERLEAYDATTAARAIERFVDDLSNWYVRRNRRRFWNEDPAAFATLRRSLLTVAQLLAPFCPFIADEIYDNLDGNEPSVHLTDWPTVGARDEALERAMVTAREAVGLGLRARASAKVGLRRPLGEAVIVASGAERAALEWLADVVREELNVKRLKFVDEADELGSYELKPNYRALGPRFGKQMPLVAEAVAALDPATAAPAVRAGGTVGIMVGGREHRLSGEDLQIGLQPLDGFQVEREAGHAVALDLKVTDDLRREGLARELVRVIQNERKEAGLKVTDRITLALFGEHELVAIAREHETMIASEVLATAVSYRPEGRAESVASEADVHRAETTIDGELLTLALAAV